MNKQEDYYKSDSDKLSVSNRLIFSLYIITLQRVNIIVIILIDMRIFY